MTDLIQRLIDNGGDGHTGGCQGCYERVMDEAAAEIGRLRAALNNARRGHYGCDDRWYSCPKHEDGCANDADGTECNCGADSHNAAIDAALSVHQQSIAEK